MSGKIAKSIGKATKSLKATLSDYNAQRAMLNPPHGGDLPLEITWIQTTDQSSPLWQTAMPHTIGIPAAIRQEAIQKYFLQLRCKEEISLLKEEMNRAVLHTYERIANLLESLPTICSCESSSTLGTTCLIKVRILELLNTAESFTDKFSPFVNVPLLPSETATRIMADFGELPSIDLESNASETVESDADEEWCSWQNQSLTDYFELLGDNSSSSDSDDEHM